MVVRSTCIDNRVGFRIVRCGTERVSQPLQRHDFPPINRETMIVLVYHVKSEAPRGMLFFEQETTWSERKEHYELVAHGEFDSLERAWEATQNITHSWTLNKGVWAHRDQLRSTSVGDLLMVEKGCIYEVATLGFRNIANDATYEDVAPVGAEYRSKSVADD